MKLRYFQVYDKNGMESPIDLQYWREDDKQWINVPFVRVSFRDEKAALLDKNWDR